MIESTNCCPSAPPSSTTRRTRPRTRSGRSSRLTRWKVGRLLAQAKARGFIRIEIVHPRARRLPVERRLRDERGLADAIVVSTVGRRRPGRAAGAHRAGRRRLPRRAASRAAHARRSAGGARSTTSRSTSQDGWADGRQRRADQRRRQPQPPGRHRGLHRRRHRAEGRRAAPPCCRARRSSSGSRPSSAIESDRAVAAVLDLASSADAYLFSAGAADAQLRARRQRLPHRPTTSTGSCAGRGRRRRRPVHRRRRQHRRPGARRADHRPPAREPARGAAQHRRHRRGRPSTPSPTPSSRSGLCTVLVTDEETALHLLETDATAPAPRQRGPGHTMTGTQIVPAGSARSRSSAARPNDANLRRYLHGIPGVDAVGLEQRAAGLGTRSIKTTSKAWALDRIIGLIDLTTLEGADTPGKVRSLVAKAVTPDAGRPRAARASPRSACTATWCRTPSRRSARPTATRTTGKHRRRRGRHRVPERPLVARRSSSRTRPTPSPRVPTRSTWSSTAGRSSPAATARSTTRSSPSRRPAAAPTAPTPTSRSSSRPASSNTYDNVRRASWLAILAGGDFIKTSTGKVAPAATLPVTLLMLEVVRDWHRLSGEKIGVKPAGGIRASKDAIKYLVTVAETVGEEWLDAAPVPVRRLEPAQRRAAAAPEDDDRALLRPRLRDDRLKGPQMSFLEYAPAPESQAILNLRDELRPLHRRRVPSRAAAPRSRPSRPATEKHIATIAHAERGRRRRRRRRRPPRLRPHLVAHVRRATAASTCSASRASCRSAPRARRRREPRQRQAHQGEPRRRRAARRRLVLLLRGLGRQARPRRPRRRPRARSASPRRSSRGTSRC